MNIKRLDDPIIPVATNPVGLIIYGMQGGQTVRVPPALLESIGIDGINGKSAYQVAIDNGFVGTQAQWLNSLIGKHTVMTEAEFAALPVKNEDVIYLIIEE